MTEMHTPVEVVFAVFGGAAGVAEACNRHRTAPYGWRAGGRRRQPGTLPADVVQTLLAHAEARGLPLRAEHLIRGASASELAALLAETPAPSAPSAARVAAE